MTFRLTSPAFVEGQTIPKPYTGDGSDRSPPLAWSGAPEGTASFALVCDDPDAPRQTWVHWVLFDLPAGLTGLEPGVAAEQTVAGGGVQGTNDFGNLGYGGPAPPRGKPHRYFFRLYALDTLLTLRPGATNAEVLEAIRGHVLAETHLMGIYQR